MRDISVSSHISKSVAMEYIAAAVVGNTHFEVRSICGFDVDFVDIDSRHKEHHSERLARVVACNQERTIVAVAYVSSADCGGCQPREQNVHVQDKQITNRNAQFLAVIDGDTRAEILDSIAVHYGITPEKAFAEVTDGQAEHLLDYMIEPLRTPTSVLMQRHGMRGW